MISSPFRHSIASPIDGWCEKTQYSLRSGVKFQRRSHQQQPRRVGPQHHAPKGTGPGELDAVQVSLQPDRASPHEPRRRLGIVCARPRAARSRYLVATQARAPRRRPGGGSDAYGTERWLPPFRPCWQSPCSCRTEGPTDRSSSRDSIHCTAVRSDRRQVSFRTGIFPRAAGAGHQAGRSGLPARSALRRRQSARLGTPAMALSEDH